MAQLDELMVINLRVMSLNTDCGAFGKKNLQQGLNPNLVRLFRSVCIIIPNVLCTASHCRHVKDPPLPLS